MPKYKRLYPDGPECRLKGAYGSSAPGYETDAAGNVTAILAEYDPDSRGGDPADGRKVKGATIHWVDAATAVDAQVRLYDNLFTDAEPDAGDKNFLDCLNPSSLEALPHAKVEAGLAGAEAPASFQFLRQGYFCVDNKDSAPGHLVFNRSVSLRTPSIFKPQNGGATAGPPRPCGRPPFAKQLEVCVMKKYLFRNDYSFGAHPRFWRRCAPSAWRATTATATTGTRPGQAHQGGVQLSRPHGGVPHRRHPDQRGGLLLPAQAVGGGHLPRLRPPEQPGGRV